MKIILENRKSWSRGLTILMFLISFIITYFKISSINNTIHADKNKKRLFRNAWKNKTGQ